MTEDDNTNKKTDDDPNGEKLLNAKDYIEECIPFIKALLEFAPNKIETHILASQVYTLKSIYYI